MVMAQTLFIALREQHSDVSLDVLAPAWSEPLLAAMPEVDEAITMPLGHGQFSLGVRRRLGRQLRGRYEQAIVLPNSWKSALVPWFAGITQRTGWRGEMRYGLLNDLRRLDSARFPAMIQRYVALAQSADAAPRDFAAITKPRLVVADAKREQFKEKFSINSSRPLLALCPGAEFGPAKRWPEAHFAAVATARIEAGDQVLLLGSGNDVPVTRAIHQQIRPDLQDACLDLAGKTSLGEAILAMSLCAGVVSNDSGLMHIAAALGRPLVAVYGSTSTRYTPPLGSQVATLSIPVDCGPCFERECPLGHYKCLTGLQPQRVVRALEALSA